MHIVPIKNDHRFFLNKSLVRLFSTPLSLYQVHYKYRPNTVGPRTRQAHAEDLRRMLNRPIKAGPVLNNIKRSLHVPATVRWTRSVEQEPHMYVKRTAQTIRTHRRAVKKRRRFVRRITAYLTLKVIRSLNVYLKSGLRGM